MIEDVIEIARQRRRDRHRVERVGQRGARNALAQELHPPRHAERGAAQAVEGQRLRRRGFLVGARESREDLQAVPGVVRRVDVLRELEAQVDLGLVDALAVRQRNVDRPLDAAGVVRFDLQSPVGGVVAHAPLGAIIGEDAAEDEGITPRFGSVFHSEPASAAPRAAKGRTAHVHTPQPWRCNKVPIP